jgi:hypothetical protein
MCPHACHVDSLGAKRRCLTQADEESWYRDEQTRKWTGNAYIEHGSSTRIWLAGF